MAENEEHILPGAADPNPSTSPPPKEPREIFPLRLDKDIGYDADFRPVNTVDFPDEDLPDPKDSSALEPVKSSGSDSQTQTETETANSSGSSPAKTVSPPAAKVSTPAKV